MSYVLPTIRRVAVIGAGPGGLVAAKQLKEEGAFDKITVFERNDQVGGTWIYSPEKNANPPLPSDDALKVDPPNVDRPFQRLRSAMYAGLHTNLPKTVMCYRDFNFGKDVPFFPSHDDVLTYLQQFAAAFELEPLIRLNTSVVRADYANDEWTLTLQTPDQKTFIDTFDAVVVATGHYAIPYIPPVEGIEALDNVPWIHSREYRNPEDYKDQTVLVIGSGSSGLDIVRETSKVATKVYHCVRSDNKQSLQAHALDSANVERVGLVQRILADGAIECGDKVLKVDQIVFATGYLFSFPFFPFEQDNLIVDGHRVEHLHEFMFYTKNPTLAFMGLPIRIVPLPLSQSQAVLIARCWNSGRPTVGLPALEETVNKSQDGNPSFVLNVESEFAYVERLGAWAEGYSQDADQLTTWRSKSTDPLTCPLSEKWKQERIDALILRKQYLGY